MSSSSYVHSPNRSSLLGGYEIQQQQQPLHHLRVVESSSSSSLLNKNKRKSGSSPNIEEEGSDELGHVCQLHNDTLNHCLKEAGTYLCQVYANRSYIIRKLGSYEHHSTREELYPLETKARIIVNSESIIWESNEDLCTFYRDPSLLKSSISNISSSKSFKSTCKSNNNSNTCNCCISHQNPISSFSAPVSLLSFSQPPPSIPSSSSSLSNHHHFSDNSKEVVNIYPEIKSSGSIAHKTDLIISYTNSNSNSNTRVSKSQAPTSTKSVTFLSTPSYSKTNSGPKRHYTATSASSSSFDVTTETTWASKSPQIYPKLNNKKLHGKSLNSEGASHRQADSSNNTNSSSSFTPKKSKENPTSFLKTVLRNNCNFIMEQYILEQRLQIIKIYYKSGESFIQTL
ncbi:uncharacterized protein [Lepeophtheirus salmonis]|uniref:uncharacterized protein isoform X2 n=1 Tax=Lepeophtheirus salmonis TaxID=72036 RepID=UPI003AF35C41